MDQSVLAYIKVARTGAAAPVISLAVCDVLLEMVELRVVLLLKLHDLFVYGYFFRTKRLELSITVMDDPDRRSKSKFNGAMTDGQRILRIVDPPAYYAIDVHMKFGEL